MRDPVVAWRHKPNPHTIPSWRRKSQVPTVTLKLVQFYMRTYYDEIVDAGPIYRLVEAVSDDAAKRIIERECYSRNAEPLDITVLPTLR